MKWREVHRTPSGKAAANGEHEAVGLRVQKSRASGHRGGIGREIGAKKCRLRKRAARIANHRPASRRACGRKRSKSELARQQPLLAFGARRAAGETQRG